MGTARKTQLRPKVSGNRLPHQEHLIQRASARNGKTTEFKIDGVDGLSLIVQPSGVGTYYVRYQVHVGGKRMFRREKIGRRDRLSWMDARAKAKDILNKVEKGSDPVAEAKEQASKKCFQQLFEHRLKHDTDTAPSTLKGYEQALVHRPEGGKSVMDQIGHVSYDALSPEKLSDVLSAVKLERGEHIAHRIRSAIGSTYRKSDDLRVRKANPARDVGFIVKSNARTRKFSDEELVKIWHGLGTSAVSEPMQILIKLGILLAQRQNELAGAMASELTLDGDLPKWTIQPSRMKIKREQVVPLVPEAVALFRRALELRGKSPYVFPANALTAHGEIPKQPHVARSSVAHAFTRMLKRQNIEGATFHDLRRTLTTWLGERQVFPSVLDAILHHMPEAVTSKHYNMATMQKPMRDALTMWTKHVWEVTGQSKTEPGNVVQMNEVRG